MHTTTLSVAALALGVLAYGVGGAYLTEGSENGLGRALRSRAWWTGTAGQALGFLFTLIARRDLPMLLVQASVVAALGVTVILQHRSGQRRMELTDWSAVGAVIVGISAIGAATIPGPAATLQWVHTAAIVTLTIATAGTLVVRLPPVAMPLIHGIAAGVGFGAMAVAARLLVSDPQRDPWRIWEFNTAAWLTGMAGVTALGLAQAHLTRGLSSGRATGVLSSMYGVATALSALVGWTLLDEKLRPGTGTLLALGAVLGIAGTYHLIRRESEPLTPAAPQR